MDETANKPTNVIIYKRSRTNIKSVATENFWVSSYIESYYKHCDFKLLMNSSFHKFKEGISLGTWLSRFEIWRF